MTDKEIIKALECCGGENYEDTCPKCPIRSDENCNCNLAKYSLDLINHQKAEIDKMKAIVDQSDTNCRRVINLIGGYERQVETARAEAVKDLIEKLTEEYKEYTLADSVSIDRIFLSIKHIARRMVGEG